MPQGRREDVSGLQQRARDEARDLGLGCGVTLLRGSEQEAFN
jgi:hypothetical protein